MISGFGIKDSGMKDEDKRGFSKASICKYFASRFLVYMDAVRTKFFNEKDAFHRMFVGVLLASECLLLICPLHRKQLVSHT
jgi:hypothetical protein